MLDYMDRFGFYQKPPARLPGLQLAASGVFDDGRLLDPGPRSTSAGWRSARSACW